jgi:hypothetical protein
MVRGHYTDPVGDPMSDDLIKSFQAFDAENPRVYDLFVRFAHEARNAGYQHFSAHGILHRIRWETGVVTRDATADWKVNNNYSAFYARKLVADDPRFKGFFRNRVSAADMVDAA